MFLPAEKVTVTVGRLTVKRRVDKNKRRQWRVECDCECGKTTLILEYNLKNGNTRSCGCLNRELTKAANTVHGLTYSRVSNSYRAMIARCYDRTHDKYKYYGGRGITVCERWRRSFSDFVSDMGLPPPGMTLDRYPDNETGNYEPGNCRWATRKQQARNMRHNVRITAFGITRLLIEWSEASGLKATTISMRLGAYKWTPEKALATPDRKGNRYKHGGECAAV